MILVKVWDTVGVGRWSARWNNLGGDVANYPKPPDTFVEFVTRYPELGRAWEAARQAERAGPLEEKTCRLLKLAVAIGARSEGAVRSAARKAVAAGVSPAEMEQVIALSASTLGFPQTVAAYSWIRELLAPAPETGE